jgi:type IV pilus assembly protein PilB
MESVMKLNPDCILIRNINHPEAAKAAFNAACMGYLVVATMNSVSTLNMIEKLNGFKIDNHLILNGLSAIIYQKLLPALCEDCSKEVSTIDSKSLSQKVQKLPSIFKQELPRQIGFYEQGKCFFCKHGSKNLEPIYELLPFNNQRRKLLSEKVSRNQVLKIFRQNELITLKQHALIKALKGKVSYQTYKEV